MENNFCAICEISNSDFHTTINAVSSFIETNTWFTGEIVLLNIGQDIDEHNINKIKLVYSNCRIVKPDDSAIVDRLRKRKNTDKRSKYLFLQAFKIKSKGNIYFSKNNLFMKEISSMLENEKISVPIDSFAFPDLNIKNKDLNCNLIYVPEKYINDKIYDSLLNQILSVNIFDLNGESNALKSLVSNEKLNINILPNTMLANSLIFPNNKYSSFIRYNGAINCLHINTSNLHDSFNFKRIHNFWQQQNHTVNNKIAKPTKVKNTRHIKRKKRNPSIKDINNNNLTINKDILNSGESLKASNICLCTICDDKFIPGLIVMLKSFIENNLWFNQKIIILYNKQYSNISDSNMLSIKILYDNIEFKEVNSSDYDQLINKFKINARGNKKVLRLIPSLFTFEIFDIVKDYDTLLYLDSDMIILDDISEVFKLKDPMVVTPDAGNYDTKRSYYTFNGGFMVLKKEISQLNYKQKLIDYADKMKIMVLADQTIMNSFFKKSLPSLDSRYNCLKRCYPDNKFNRFDSSIKIIHYVGDKPWYKNKKGIELRYNKIEKIWLDYYDKINNKNKIKVLVVGNSPNNLKKKKGKVIDSFDIVIRINDFKINGFEDYVGTKTTHWVTSFSPAIDNREINIFNKVFTANFNQTNEIFNKRIKRIIKKDSDINNKLLVLSKLEIENFKKQIGYDTKHKWPTTGMVAIYVALNKIENSDVYFHGFSFFKEIGQYVSHYWNETKKEEFRKHHNHRLEEKYINDLIKSKKIKIL